MYIYKHFPNTELLSGQSLKNTVSLSNQQKNSKKRSSCYYEAMQTYNPAILSFLSYKVSLANLLIS